jgi:hypothetical protein
LSNWTLPVLVKGHNFYDIECIILLPTTLMYVCHVFLAFSQLFASSSKFFQTHKMVWVDPMNLIQVLKALAINKKKIGI